MRKHIALVFIWLVLLLGISPLFAQSGDLRATAGYSNFLDESNLNHFVAGGSARFYLVSRMGFEPELLYMYRSTNDQDLVLQANITWDFRDKSRRVVPYAVGGVGLLRHWAGTGIGNFAANGWTANAGLGVKIFLAEKWFVAPEFRLGFEPIFRVTGSIGYAF